jgi:hypothetical protein
MLPAGVLAKHGYTTKWGFFSGVCQGSGSKPFEQATNLIEASMREQREESARLLADASVYESGTNSDEMMVNVYIGASFNRRQESGYRWKKATLTVVESHRVDDRIYHSINATYEISGSNGKVETKQVVRATRDVDAELQALRVEYAKELRRQAAQRSQYADWQEARIANWQEAPLTPR